MITDINNPAGSAKGQSEIVVANDVVTSASTGSVQYNHVPGGANVLYLDGHVKFVKYDASGGDFPMSTGYALVLGAIFN